MSAASCRPTYDVIVVGGGNAGFSAAHAAAAGGSSVLLLEKAGRDQAGGNSFYTAGAFRTSFESAEELRPLLDPATLDRLPDTVVPPYRVADFRADMARVTGGACDPVLTDALVTRSAAAMRWLHQVGIRFRLMYERQAFKRDGVWTFFGGLALGTIGGGKGLIAQHTRAAERAGVHLAYGTRLTGICLDAAGRVSGVSVAGPDGPEQTVAAPSVVLASGGFEANPGLRERYLGPGWRRALVRGTPANTGDGLQIALALGAEPYGDWATCHSVAWDAGAPPDGGDRALTNQRTRQSYPLGILVNRTGQRFVDEGADYRNYTYAKYGAEILKQPQGIAFQLFDAKTRPLLHSEEYDSQPNTFAVAGTLPELARQLGIDPGGLAGTVATFNRSIRSAPFDPAVKDGRAALTTPRKSNWAQALDYPPYWGYAVSCGITFTFGGLHITPGAQVLRADGQPIPGLFAAGELVGGLFSGNYPGGSGLTAGAVFGRAAGAGAAAHAARPAAHRAAAPADHGRTDHAR